MKLYPLILSGGAGTRLWPLSRQAFPKQLLPLIGDRSLMAQTLERTREPAGALTFAPPTVVAGDAHRFLIAEEARQAEIPLRRLILEPQGRNTAPAILAGALDIVAEDPEAILLVQTSDHRIADLSAFMAAVESAGRAAATGRFTTFGIAPSLPHTGYGYIQRGAALDDVPGAYALARFKEKPDRETAERMLAEGGHSWNSGMFVFPAAAMIAALETLEPDMVTAVRAAHAAAKSDLDFLRLDANAFAKAPSLPIDIALMEKTDRAAVVPCDIGWSDIGSYQSLWELGEKDSDGNVLTGDVVAAGSTDSYIRADKRLVAAVGLERMLVVETGDAVCVAPMDRSEEIKTLVALLKQGNREEVLSGRRVYRPWGWYESLVTGDHFQVKHIQVTPGAQLSLQRHRHRSEHWIVVSGEAEVTRDDTVATLTANQSTYIPVGTKHRLANRHASQPLEIIEVQTGDYLGEDDIERFEDRYGRA
ncbi:MAG: mannose-1-phosphate guanylyltransferase/mannose-6-phosphate isomerase [Alphaproteobacteria bacterium]|nr:mannose-1-phosphate guanylyltransferase/mannose-6-phosphate isomerase [Alphaproteobacteria bacterium]